MSRDIKFRAWNKNARRMIYADEAQQSKDLLAIGLHGLPIAVDRDSFKNDEITGWNVDHVFEIMQCTGLKDKADKDIYEGDIVVTENEQEGEWPVEGQYKGVVTYNDQRAAFYIQQPHDTYTPTLSNLAIKSIEVLGNIYEHPELIEGKL